MWILLILAGALFTLLADYLRVLGRLNIFYSWRVLLLMVSIIAIFTFVALYLKFYFEKQEPPKFVPVQEQLYKIQN